jgi:surface protein
MSKRSNSGYIGPIFRDDVQGVIDGNKNYQIRYLSQYEQYSTPTNLMGLPPIPDASTVSYLPIYSNGGGSGSTATPSLVSGSLASLTIYSGGGGYATVPTFSFSGGGGTGADGWVTAFTVNGAITSVECLGYISSAVISNPGSGYITTPTASFSAPTTATGRVGVTATASVTMSNGIITAVNIINTGSGYRASSGNYPTITINGGTPTVSASVVPIVTFGRNYTSPPTITISGGAGSGSIVSASIYAYLAPTATVNTAGAGYTVAPGVQIDGASYATTSATASLTGDTVLSISVTPGLSTFSTPPTMSVSGLPILPSVSNNQIVGTYAVYNNNSNYLAITISGSFTVDWGDGTSNNVNANAAATTVSHLYSTASYAAITASVYNGYKPVVINIQASGSGVTFKSVDFTTKPTPTTGSFPAQSITNGWIDIRMAGSDISSLVVGSPFTSSPCRILERFEYSGSNKITSFANTFARCNNLKQIVSLYTTLGTNFGSMFDSCYNLVSIPTIDTSTNNSNMSSMFTSCYSLESISLILNQTNSYTMNGAFGACYNLRSITASFGNNITSYNSAFSGCYNLLDLPLLNVSNVTDMASAFTNCASLKSIKFIGNTSKVTTFSSTFNSCNSLTDLPQTIDCTAATTLASMFSGCSSLVKAPMFTNTLKNTSCASMFALCPNLKYVPLFDTQNVTTMNNMFAGSSTVLCSGLTTIPPFNTGKVTDAAFMFAYNYGLLSVPPLNLINVTLLNSTFVNCASLKYIGQLTTSAKLTGTNATFSGCTSLKTVPLFDISQVANLGSMFISCASLQEIPPFNTGNATSLASTFSGCSSLKTIPLLNTQNVTSFSNTFNGCTALQEVPPLNTSKCTNFSSMFNSCTSLKSIPLLDTSLGTTVSTMFNSCVNLNEIPSLNFASVTTGNFSLLFNTTYNIKRNQMYGARFNIDISNGSLDSTALNEVYTNLGTAAVSGSTAITVTGNWGTANDDPTIANAKGWVVTG